MGTKAKGNSMVEMRDVIFCYDEGKRALDSISINLEKGSVTALVGPSGGGKSTIIKLLLGFYPADGGSIAINGKPIGSYTLEGLRSMSSYVPQDSYLFDGTVAENIRYGRPEASMEEIIAAAKAANANDFIMDMAEGYDTLVGERGTRLSGGQRQRIAIARAVLKDAPILLLDEATSSLDTESEQQVQNALGALMKGRTVLVVAHRLSTVENADAIYVIDGGRVVEKGSHSELAGRMGLYKRLYELQFLKREVTVAS